jgi:hypothetical protein
MTPVRIEFGVHFCGEAGFEELGWEEARAVVEECIRRASEGFSANAHSLSMERRRDANRADHKIILYSIAVSSGSPRRPCSLLIRITVPIKVILKSPISALAGSSLFYIAVIRKEAPTPLALFLTSISA